MKTFRHKTAKSSFKWKLTAVTALNVVVAGALIYAAGRWDWI